MGVLRHPRHPPSAVTEISIDKVGPITTTPRGNKQILRIQDNLTKYCIAVAIPDTKLPTIADALAKNVISIYGA